MIDLLRQMAIFAKTVDHGSFRGAAKALNLSPSVVSHHVSHLEEQLGTALLYRSTRRLAVTDDGARLLIQARAMVSAAEAGLEDLAERGRELSGQLSLTMPAVMAQTVVTERIAQFSMAHPNVHLSLDFSDTRRELIGAGFDVAVRMGWLKDSTLMARKLFDLDRYLVAAPDYLKTRKMPDAPHDLEDWDWLELAPVPLRPRFRMPDGKTIGIRPSPPRLSVNDAQALRHLARSGAGLAMLPDRLVARDIREGHLIRIGPDWLLDRIGVYVTWPPNAPKGGLIAHLVSALAGKGAGA